MVKQQEASGQLATVSSRRNAPGDAEAMVEDNGLSYTTYVKDYSEV